MPDGPGGMNDHPRRVMRLIGILDPLSAIPL
jgi:hypothetical protein